MVAAGSDTRQRCPPRYRGLQWLLHLHLYIHGMSEPSSKPAMSVCSMLRPRETGVECTPPAYKRGCQSSTMAKETASHAKMLGSVRVILGTPRQPCNASGNLGQSRMISPPSARRPSPRAPSRQQRPKACPRAGRSDRRPPKELSLARCKYTPRAQHTLTLRPSPGLNEVAD